MSARALLLGYAQRAAASQLLGSCGPATSSLINALGVQHRSIEAVSCADGPASASSSLPISFMQVQPPSVCYLPRQIHNVPLSRGFAASASSPLPREPDGQPEPRSQPAARDGRGDDAAAPPSADHPTALPPQPLTQDVLYEGPLAKTHKLLKRVSLANTALAFAAAPAIVWLTDISYVSRIGLATSLIVFGVLTTGALHWITQPYVHELRFDAATQTVTVRTTTLFGRQRVSSFALGDVQPLPWNRPVATFTAGGKFYYIDVYSFPDPDLLQRLTPPEDSVPPGYKDDDKDDY